MTNPHSSPSDPSLTECREFDIRITSDGTWHYRGSPIGRMALVRLFAGVLKRDETGDYWLETPVERGRIQVDDAPFLAVDVTVEGAGQTQRLHFHTNLDEIVTADPAHPIHMRPGPQAFHVRPGPQAFHGNGGPEDGDMRPYLHLRDGIEALIARPVYYRLADLADEHVVGGVPTLGVWSSGVFFPFAAVTWPAEGAS